MVAHRIALVDDDALFLRTLSMNLEDAGFAVRGFGDGHAAMAGLTEDPAVDLLLLDWQMPGLDGLELLGRLREAGIAAPAVFLTSLTQPIFEELALERGAVDFVEKTRSFSILLKRLKLVLGGAKQGAGPRPPVPSVAAAGPIGSLSLNPETKRAQWKSREVPLSLGEYEVVAALAARPGVDVSYRELYDHIRGEGFLAGDGAEGYRANVRAMIKRIRRKFAEIDPGFEALENYPGFGYRWRSDGP